MSNDSKIMERLAKLLELADRGDEHEAEVAAQRAAELMARHQIEMHDVTAFVAGQSEIKVEHGRVDGEDADDPSRCEKWHRALLKAVADALGSRGYVEPTTNPKFMRFRIVGPVDSVRAGRYLFMSITRQINRLSREAGRRHGETSNAWRRAYALGMVARVRERLVAGRASVMGAASSTALVWIDKTKEKVDEFVKNKLELRQIKSRAVARPDAADWGYRDGDKVDVGDNSRGRLGAEQKKLP